MEATVSHAAVVQSPLCRCDFQCQTPEWEPCARALRVVDRNLLELDPDPTREHSCRYCLNLGEGHYCACPARFEIYNQHQW
jgi:hypothetical protein